ncbi:hypothetical protein BASA81_012932 [Batrachochytrium salamandrivorans]|nr:hypothetical protein BASA81_012932 [Batrachochytrium salamandrivorans]
MQLFAQKQIGGGQLLIKLIELFDLDQNKRVQLFDLGSELTFSQPNELVKVIELAFTKPDDLPTLFTGKIRRDYGEEEYNICIATSLVFRYMQVARQVPRDQIRCVLQTVHSALTVFAEQHMTALTRVKVIKLFLQLALQADELGEEDSVSYECMKQDQARCLAQSSALFWNLVNSRNGKRALECLQRAGKTCPKDMLIQVDLLNLYVVLYQGNADKVKAASFK